MKRALREAFLTAPQAADKAVYEKIVPTGCDAHDEFVQLSGGQMANFPHFQDTDSQDMRWDDLTSSGQGALLPEGNIFRNASQSGQVGSGSIVRHCQTGMSRQHAGGNEQGQGHPALQVTAGFVNRDASQEITPAHLNPEIVVIQVPQNRVDKPSIRKDSHAKVTRKSDVSQDDLGSDPVRTGSVPQPVSDSVPGSVRPPQMDADRVRTPDVWPPQMDSNQVRTPDLPAQDKRQTLGLTARIPGFRLPWTEHTL
jgi:hypothetical protein